MGSVHIRVSAETKKKLDNIKAGQVVLRSHGYKGKMQYEDIIQQMLDNDYFESQDRVNFAMIQHICSHILEKVQYDNPCYLLQTVTEYLKMFLDTTVCESDIDNYKPIYEYLVKQLKMLVPDY